MPRSNDFIPEGLARQQSQHSPVPGAVCNSPFGLKPPRPHQALHWAPNSGGAAGPCGTSGHREGGSDREGSRVSDSHQAVEAGGDTRQRWGSRPP